MNDRLRPARHACRDCCVHGPRKKPGMVAVRQEWRLWLEGSAASFRSTGRRMLVATALGMLSVSGLLRAEEEQRLMSVEDCVAFALEHAPSWRQTGLEPGNQVLRTIIASQKFASRLAMSSSYDTANESVNADSRVSREWPGGWTSGVSAGVLRDDDGEESWRYAAELSKILVGGGSVAASRIDVDNSEIDELVAQNNILRTRLDLIRNVRKQYYGIIREQQTLGVRRIRLERSRRNLEHAIQREEPLDIATAQIEVPESEAALLRAERQVESALRRLRELIGMSLRDTLLIEGEVPFVVMTPQLDEDRDALLAGHEDVLNQQLRMLKIDNELRVARERVAPRLSISGRVQGQSEDSALSDVDWEQRVSLSLDWPVGARAERARVRLAERSLEAAHLELSIISRRLDRELTDLAERLDEALRQVELGRARFEVAERRAALYEDRWDSGEIDILEYIRSQNDLEDNRVALINNEIAYLELLEDYQALTGSGANR